MMLQSVNALPESPADNELWKATLFAKWYCEFLFVSIHEHHDAEEKIYFPFIKTKTEYPEKEFSKDHKSLMVAMDEMLKACETICKKGGKGCEKEIALMKEKADPFVKDMNAHLKEEEETISSLLRDNFTQEEEGAIVEKIIQAGGLLMTKTFLPGELLFRNIALEFHRAVSCLRLILVFVWPTQITNYIFSCACCNARMGDSRLLRQLQKEYSSSHSALGVKVLHS